MRLSIALAATLIIGLTACHHDANAPLGPLNGSWSGSVTGDLSMDLQLSDKGGEVTGSGDMSGPGIVNPPILFNISGTEDGSSFTTTLTATDRAGTVSFTGTVANPTTLSATLNGSGFAGLGITLTRQ